MSRSSLCALISLAFLASPAMAAPVHFQAQPATQPAQARIVARDNLWTCTPAGCSSARSSTRPAIVCSTLVREIGPLTGFSAGGVAFTAEQLEACNARARP